jgi:hypothetical protein
VSDTPEKRHEHLDARALIEGDLDQLQRERRRHFVPALLLAAVALGSFIVIGGVRPDLLSQPPWQLLIQVALWALCLVVFPAIGLGLMFPGRVVRVLLAVGAVLLTFAATLGWPSDLVPNHDRFSFDGCMMMLTLFGVGLLGLGLFSGAFVQRRRTSAVYWIAAGVALAALNTVTWHCPNTGAAHVMPNHIGGAVVMMVLASVVGFVVHRRRRAGN